jgi:predicted outer membrane repeat protein
MHGRNSSPVLRDCAFIDNDAGSGGGAWFEGESAPLFVRCVFRGNAVVGIGGGAASDWDARPQFLNCVIESNTASTGGGLCICAGNAGVWGCDIRGNRATFGGGAALLSGRQVSFDDTDIVDNLADHSGGGIYAESSSIELVDCSLTANASLGGGGALWLMDSSVSLSSFSMLGNRTTSGAAVSAGNSSVSMSAGRITRNGLAVGAREGVSSMDVRFNWWGGPSGPYHADLNPGGAGDDVADGVEFAPWLVVDALPERPVTVERSWAAIKALYR